MAKGEVWIKKRAYNDQIFNDNKMNLLQAQIMQEGDRISKMKRMLIITDLESTKSFFKEHFSNQFNLVFALNASDAISNFGKELFEYILIDLLNFKEFKCKELSTELFNQYFSSLERSYPTAKKIFMAERRLTKECVIGIRLGFDNYINYPLIIEEVQYVLDLVDESARREAVSQHFETKILKSIPKYNFDSKSMVMRNIFQQVESVAQTKTTVLITGESGTGKSVLAKTIHDLSSRSNCKFISTHCGAISDGLIESELFGHEKGSFTGAIKRKLGKFELAHNGTIFLDEIGTVSKATQVNLLQVIQERFFQRVGGEEDINIDVRIIAATNIDLKQSVLDNSFREDLYYRLNVFPIEIPPLRERPEDIKELSLQILYRLNCLYNKKIDSIHRDVELAFLGYSWPGNIRELENVIERAYVLEKTNVLSPENFPVEMFQVKEIPKKIINYYPTLNLNEARRHTLDNFEREYLHELFKASQGSLKKASELSGVTIRQLHKFISKHRINRKEFCLTS